MKRYAIVIEKAASNYSAYVPDLPGCVATGPTPEETERLLGEAIELHLEGMREDGEPIPEPTSRVEYVAVDARPGGNLDVRIFVTVPARDGSRPSLRE